MRYALLSRPHACAVPLPGDGFAAALGLEPAARYDVADEMGLDSFSADTSGAAAMADSLGEDSPWADGSAAAPPDGGSEAGIPRWAGGQRQLKAAAASSCIGTTFTVASVRAQS